MEHSVAADPEVEMRLSDIHWLPSHRALFVVVNVNTLALFYPDTKTLEEVCFAFSHGFAFSGGEHGEKFEFNFNLRLSCIIGYYR